MRTKRAWRKGKTASGPEGRGEEEGAAPDLATRNDGSGLGDQSGFFGFTAANVASKNTTLIRTQIKNQVPRNKRKGFKLPSRKE